MYSLYILSHQLKLAFLIVVSGWHTLHLSIVPDTHTSSTSRLHSNHILFAGSAVAFPIVISTSLIVLTACQATSDPGRTRGTKWLWWWSQTVLVTKPPVSAPPNRVLPTSRVVTVEAHSSQPQASKQPSDQTDEKRLAPSSPPRPEFVSLLLCSIAVPIMTGVLIV